MIIKKQTLGENCGVKEKLRSIWFTMVVFSVLSQTALSFFMLYKKATDKLMGDIIIVLTLTYILAFLLIAGLSLHAKKISREAMVGYKRSLKVTKRVLTLLMLVVSIMNIVTAGGGGLDFIFSIILVIFNLIIIYIDSLVSRVKDKFARKAKKREREEKNQKVRAFRIGQSENKETKQKRGNHEK